MKCHVFCEERALCSIIERERERERERVLSSSLINTCTTQARRQEFPEGGSSTRAKRGALTAGGLGAAQGPQKLWVFGAKSFNLAISRHFIQTFGKSCFSKFKFYTNKDFDQ